MRNTTVLIVIAVSERCLVAAQDNQGKRPSARAFVRNPIKGNIFVREEY